MLDLKKTDIAAISEEGYKFQLLLPEVKTPLDAWITVRGANAQKVKDFAKKKFSEMQRLEVIAKRKGKDVDPMTLDEAEEMAIDSAALRVKAWEGICEGKVEVPCDEENIKRILKQHAWLREAILEASDNLANFLD